MPDSIAPDPVAPDSAAIEQRSILIVDDIFSIRLAIEDYLSPYYRVASAGSGKEALDRLAREHFDIVLSDIRMAGMSGVELIQEIQREYPGVQYALMTAYNVNDYVRYARQYRIWNIIPKSTFLNLHFVKVMIDKLTGTDLFGFSLYFPGLNEKAISLGKVYVLHRDEHCLLPDRTLFHCNISSEEERFRLCDMVADIFRRHRAMPTIRVILEELTVNAKDYGSEEFKKPIELSFGTYGDNLLFSVTDTKGELKRDEILYRLERNLTCDEKGRPLSLTDEHGRGLFISRENLDQLIFNIEAGKKTEILGILEPQSEYRNKAISIYFRGEEEIVQ